MNNYFSTQQIHWHNFSPEDICFKSNSITKRLMPEENILSYKTKTDRDTKDAVRHGGVAHTSKWGYTTIDADYTAVYVQLTDVKKAEYIGANIDFVDRRVRQFSNGNLRGSLDVLVYVQSSHNQYEWKKDAHGNWVNMKRNTPPLPDDEGYRIAYGGQGDTNPMTHRELLEIIDISEAVRKFLIEKVLPLKRKEVSEKTSKNLQAA